MTVRVVRHRVPAVGGRVGLPGGQLRRGHGRGRFRMSISQPPRMLVLMRVPLTRERSRNPLAPLRFSRRLPNRSLRFWAENGAGSDPPPNVGSTAPRSGLMQALPLPVGGRSQPAPAARFIPAGRPPTRPRAGRGSGAMSPRTTARQRRSLARGPAPRRRGAGDPALAEGGLVRDALCPPSSQ